MGHIQTVRLRRLCNTVLALLIVVLWLATALSPVPARAQGGDLTPRIYLPVLMKTFVRPEDRVCRIGVGSTSDIASYKTLPLRIGWYMDWQAWTHPARPGGIAYAPTIRLHHDPRDPDPSSYTIPWPDPKTITATVKANPGAMWIIGNEPDRRYYQDGVEAQVYARAYHELYYMIKNLDATAQIVAGNIVEPTPLRLRYLDAVLQKYQTRYGQKMPVDVWSVHSYPLNEKSCEARCGYSRNECTGAEIPPGFSECAGTAFSFADSGDPALFEQFVHSIRDWMAKNGYRDTALILPEWGVLMPQSVVSAGGVNNYMNTTMNYVLNATDPTIGYPADDNRLVQRAAWFSLNIMTLGDGFTLNGWLFDPNSKARTVYGDNLAARTAGIAPTINLKPASLGYEAVANPPGSIQLTADIVNNGNIGTSQPFLVRFYDGDPLQGGVQIGQDHSVGTIDGCATPRIEVTQTWTGAASGTHTVFVVVDPTGQIIENKADNSISTSVTVS